MEELPIELPTLKYLIFDTIEAYKATNHAISQSLGYERDGTSRYAPEEPDTFDVDNKPVMLITTQVQEQCVDILSNYQLVDLFQPFVEEIQEEPIND